MGLGEERRAVLAAQGLAGREVYHLTALENVPSILEKGVLPHSSMNGSQHTDISLQSAQDKRSAKCVRTGPGKSSALHELVPLFFTWSTPMVFLRAKDRSRLALLVFDLAALCGDEFEVAFTSMNASSPDARFEHDFERIGAHVPWADFKSKYWKGVDDEGNPWNRSRERAAELLVAPVIPPALVRRIEVRDASSYWTLVSDERVWCDDRVYCQPEHFFDSAYAKYEPLEDDLLVAFLRDRGEVPIKVTMPFSTVSFVVGGLPDDAYRDERWWTATNTVQSQAWRDYAIAVDVEQQAVAFEPRMP